MVEGGGGGGTCTDGKLTTYSVGKSEQRVPIDRDLRKDLQCERIIHIDLAAYYKAHSLLMVAQFTQILIVSSAD